MVAVPKPTPVVREPKRLKAQPRPVDKNAAAATFSRDDNLCQWCRRPGGRLVPHHRFRRSQGGKDDSFYMVSVHALCHSYIHDHVAEAKRRGFLVSSKPATPSSPSSSDSLWTRRVRTVA